MKNVTNKQVIRAISLGISTLMTLQPVSALADELENVVPENGENVSAEEITPIDEAAKQGEVSRQAIYDISGNNDALSAEEAAKRLEAAKEVSDAFENISNAALLAEDALENIEAIETNLENADKAVAAAGTAAGKASLAAINAENAVTEYNKDAQTALENAMNAEDEESARAALNEVNELINDAVYSEAVEAYGAAKSEFDTALDDLQKAKENYEDALKNASEDTKDALEDLEEAKDAYEKSSEEKAKKAQELAESAAGKIAELEKKLLDDDDVQGADYWNVCDNLFKEIMQEYYMPEVLKAQKVVSISNAIKPKKGDSSQNYFEIVYIDSQGNEQTGMYNYTLDGTNSGLLKITEKVVVQEEISAEVPEHYHVIDDGKEYDAAIDDISESDIITIDGKDYIRDDTNISAETAADIVEGTTSNEDNPEVEVNGNITKTTVTETVVDIDESSEKSTRTINNGWGEDRTTADVTYTTNKVITEIENCVWVVENVDNEMLSVEEACKILDEKGISYDKASVGIKTTASIIKNGTEVTLYEGDATYIPRKTKTKNISKIYDELSDIEDAKDEFYSNYKDVDDISGLTNAWNTFIGKGKNEYKYDVQKSEDYTVSEEIRKEKFLGIPYDEDYFTVNGSISVTYSDIVVENQQVKFLDQWFDRDGVEEKAKAYVESIGGIFLSMEPFDYNMKTVKIAYVKPETVSVDSKSGQYESKEEAEQALREKIQAKIDASQNDDLTGAADIKVNVKESGEKGYKDKTVYNHSISYTTTKETRTSESTKKTETLYFSMWDADEIVKVDTVAAVTNDKYVDGEEILLDERNDEDFRSVVDGNSEERLSLEEESKAEANAAELVGKAIEEVKKLQGKISNISAADYDAEISELSDTVGAAGNAIEEIDLTDTNSELDTAKTNLEDIIKKFDDAKTDDGDDKKSDNDVPSDDGKADEKKDTNNDSEINVIPGSDVPEIVEEGDGKKPDGVTDYTPVEEDDQVVTTGDNKQEEKLEGETEKEKQTEQKKPEVKEKTEDDEEKSDSDNTNPSDSGSSETGSTTPENTNDSNTGDTPDNTNDPNTGDVTDDTTKDADNSNSDNDSEISADTSTAEDTVITQNAGNDEDLSNVDDGDDNKEITIDDDDVPTTGTPDDTTGDDNTVDKPTIEIDNEDVPTTGSVDIDENETPTAPEPIDEESISWWWLLVIAVFGATGYELYRRSRMKKVKADKKHDK